MKFEEWYYSEDLDKKTPSSFKGLAKRSWHAALKFAQQPQGAIPPDTAPHAADVRRNAFIL